MILPDFDTFDTLHLYNGLHLLFFLTQPHLQFQQLILQSQLCFSVLILNIFNGMGETDL